MGCSASQGFGITTHPYIDPSCINPKLSARDRAARLVICTAGHLPAGTRLYAASEIVGKNADGTVVLLDASGNVVQTFPRSAVIQVQKDAMVQAVLPGDPVPTKYQHSKPFEVIR